MLVEFKFSGTTRETKHWKIGCSAQHGAPEPVALWRRCTVAIKSHSDWSQPRTRSPWQKSSKFNSLFVSCKTKFTGLFVLN